MKTDKIIIEGIKQRFRIGCSHEEREWPQTLLLDIEMYLDMSKCVVSDDLRDTIDYTMVLDIVRTMAEEREWKLIEKICSDLSKEIFAACSLVTQIKTRVRKDIAEHVQSVSCEYLALRE